MSDLPVYLFSKTAHPDVNYIPILSTQFFQPSIDFSNYDAIVLTSKQAVTALKKIGSQWRELPVLTVADLTAKMAEEAGATVMSRGDGYGDSLAEIIIKSYPERRWLYPRPEVVASNFSRLVRAAGVMMDDVVVYKTSCDAKAGSVRLEDDAILIFTSPFTIACFLESQTFKSTQKIIAIGKTTKAALPDGLEVYMPEKTSVDSCVRLAHRLAG